MAQLPERLEEITEPLARADLADVEDAEGFGVVLRRLRLRLKRDAVGHDVDPVRGDAFLLERFLHEGGGAEDRLGDLVFLDAPRRFAGMEAGRREIEPPVLLPHDPLLHPDVAVYRLRHADHPGALEPPRGSQSRPAVEKEEIGGAGRFFGEPVEPLLAEKGELRADRRGQLQPQAREVEVLQMIGPEQFPFHFGLGQGGAGTEAGEAADEAVEAPGARQGRGVEVVVRPVGRGVGYLHWIVRGGWRLRSKISRYRPATVAGSNWRRCVAASWRRRAHSSGRVRMVWSERVRSSWSARAKVRPQGPTASGRPPASRRDDDATGSDALQRDDAKRFRAAGGNDHHLVGVEQEGDLGRLFFAQELDLVFEFLPRHDPAEMSFLRAGANDAQARSEALRPQLLQRLKNHVDPLVGDEAPEIDQLAVPRDFGALPEDVLVIGIADDGGGKRQVAGDRPADGGVGAMPEEMALQLRLPVATAGRFPQPGVVGDDPGPAQEKERPGHVQADVVLEIDVAPADELDHAKDAGAAFHRVGPRDAVLPDGPGDEDHLVARPDELGREQFRDGFDPAHAGGEDIGGEEDFHGGERESRSCAAISSARARGGRRGRPVTSSASRFSSQR